MHQVIIVGAGPAGLCAAKTILQLQPETNVLIVDAHASIGGVWSEEKIYPGLKTNNLNPALDYSDFPLPPSLGVPRGQHISGETMHEFLLAYADHWKLTDRIRLNVKVRQVSRLEKDKGWKLDVESPNKGFPSTLECQKLVIAVGSTNVPHQPSLKGSHSFEAPLLHSADLGYHANLIQDDKVKTVAVLGGGKSAYDAAYLAATSGKQVEWIIRKSGRGPAWVFPAYTYLGPFKAWRERLTTRRIISFLSPCVWNDGFEWIRSFFHYNSFGKMITKTFWGLLHSDTIRDCEYHKDDRLRILEPESSPFWYGTVSGVNSYDVNFHSLIFSGQIRIHREDIHHLSPKTIHLGNAQTLPVDMLITATGFSAQPVIDFAPGHNRDCSGSSLGIPCTQLDTPEESFWNQLDIASDYRIGQQYPRLLAGPRLSPTSDVLLKYNLGSSSEAEAKYSPWRLYRGIAPPGLTAHGDRSLVFIGMFSNLANTIRLEIQCLWAAVYLFDTIPRLEEDARTGRVFPETSLSQRYAQLRAPLGHGRFIPDLVFDQLPYWDILLMDLGLETRRKSGWRHGLLGWLGLREIFEAYSAEDYRGLAQEWLHKRQKKEVSSRC